MAVFLVTSADELKRLQLNSRYLHNNIHHFRDSRSIKKKYITFEDICSGACEEGNDSEIINTKKGTSVINYQYNVDFLLQNKGYNFLACLVVPYLAHPQNQSPSGLSSPRFRMGDYSIEDILFKNNPSPTRRIYKLASGHQGFGSKDEFWVGKTHTDASGSPMAGGPQLMLKNDSHPHITEREVPNIKVIDRRNQLAAQGLLPWASRAIEKIISGGERLLDKSQVLRNIESKNYFSPISYSRQSDNSLRLFFGMDLYKLARNSVKYSFLYRTPSQFISAIDITNISVYRRRTNSWPINNKLTGAPAANRSYDFNEEEKPVCSIRTGDLDSFIATQTASIRNYVGQDVEIASFTDGLYQYGVKIDFIDRSPERLSDIINRLKNASVKYNSYIKSAAVGGGYNSNQNSLSEKRIKYLYKYHKGAWVDAVLAVTNTMLDVYGPQAFQPQGQNQWMRNLLSLCSPRSATPETLLAMGEVIDNLLSKLREVYNKTTVVGNTEAISFKSKVELGASKRTIINVDYKFLSAYEVKNKTDIGLDYTPGLLTARTALPRYTITDWDARVTHEISRYGDAATTATAGQSRPGGTTPRASTAGVNVNGYLSPMSIVLPVGKSMRITQGMNYYGSLDILLAAKSTSEAYVFNNARGGEDTNTKVRELLALASISIDTLPVTTMRNLIFSDSSCLSKIKSEEIVGPSSAFNTQRKNEVDNARIRGHKDIETQSVENIVVDLIVKDMSTGFSTAQVSDLTQISDSLPAQNLKPGTNNFDFCMNYNSVQTVEYLAGYESGFAAKEIWTTLNRSKREELGSGGFLICRLRPNNSIMNVPNLYTKVLLPYNETFIIGEDPKLDSGADTTTQYSLVELPSGLSPKGPIELPVEYWKSRLELAPPMPARAKPSAAAAGGTSGGSGRSGY
tara:strand:+ start:4589 stop:7318 length:2730 start_codon:yes stop_codon:yes gene_type:complete